MEHPLTVSEMTICMDITFLFNSVRDLKMLSGKFLQLLGKLVPYEKAVIFLHHELQQQLIPCAEIRCEKSLIQEYTQRYHAMDYLGWQIYQAGIQTFRESDKIQQQERENANFYQLFMKKYDIHHRLMFNMVSSKGVLLGAAMFFRSSVFEDFTDREVEIVEMLRNHYSAGIEQSIQFEKLTRKGNLAQKVYRDITDCMMIFGSNLELTYINRKGKQYAEELKANPEAHTKFFSEIHNACRALAEGARWDKGQEQPGTVTVQVLGGTAKVSMIPPEAVTEQKPYEFVVVFSTGGEAPGKEPGQESPEEARAADSQQYAKDFFVTAGKQYGLTRREVDVMKLAVEGLENREIAERLYISLFTVKSHFQNSYAKLGVRNRQELFLLYMKYIVSEEFRREFQSQTRKDVLW